MMHTQPPLTQLSHLRLDLSQVNFPKHHYHHLSHHCRQIGQDATIKVPSNDFQLFPDKNYLWAFFRILVVFQIFNINICVITFLKVYFRF
ncbi:LOW QUALITY PROTEIN: hypothetical protein PanWU01x14_037840 [Parasponia andersonii]|uniref:Transmembrane protein n=1 Tax=Parasponia andersonii TaxID=3476 RepID=A0A2P5DS10_PARAD|nr:LOW QUALITY PROTEIN: hypothetical protein PanWU01x14_037840 [Parasponia andersonii]